jgi:hypothetical protein
MSFRADHGDGDSHVVVSVDERGERGFEENLASLISDNWSTVTVADHPAAMLTRGPALAEVRWMHTDTARVTIQITNVDEASVDAVLGALRQVPEAEWESMLARVPTPDTTIQTGP